MGKLARVKSYLAHFSSANISGSLVAGEEFYFHDCRVKISKVPLGTHPWTRLSQETTPEGGRFGGKWSEDTKISVIKQINTEDVMYNMMTTVNTAL